MKDFVYPLGSVVLAKNPDGNIIKVMIAGYGIRDKKHNKKYEYGGFEIPGGYDPDKITFLNNENIICPIFIGQISEENRKIRAEVSKHYDKYDMHLLPIGSIVEIAAGKRVMITSLCILDFVNDLIIDYMGEDLDKRLTYKFNKDEIREIIFIGFSDEKFLNYRYFLEELMKKVEKKDNIYKEIKEFMLKDGD